MSNKLPKSRRHVMKHSRLKGDIDKPDIAIVNIKSARESRARNLLQYAESELTFLFSQAETDDYEMDNIASIRDLLVSACELIVEEFPRLSKDFRPKLEYTTNELEHDNEDA